ncbi:MAG: alpha-galactosidase [Armatimonadota bacterium]|nr:alpha-galactosidase [bacterium]
MNNTDETVYFSDVIIKEGDEPVVSYRSGMTTYEESLTRGQFLGRGWNGSGFVNYYDGRINVKQGAFYLEIDGQSLISDWELIGIEVKENSQPIPAMPRPFDRHIIVKLRNRVRPIEVNVHTGLDGTPILTRWLEIKNTGDAPAAIGSVATWSGVLQEKSNWSTYLADGQPLYSLGYIAKTHWGGEGDFRWVDLADGRHSIDSRARRDRHRHPMFVLRNNATGEHFIGQFAWSGGYSFEFDLYQDAADSPAILKFQAAVDGPAPQRIVAPGETVTTPEMHLGMVFGDLDNAIQSMHDHIRRSVLMPQPRGRGCWIESGIGPEIEITEQEVFHAIDVAAEMGADLLFIDASWYAKPFGDWYSTAGDWNPNTERFPNGLKPFRDYAHEKGLLWGLWMEAERIGAESETAKAHPDWILRNHIGEEIPGMLDLSKPEVAKWMEEQIIKVIEENQVDFFRLDYNTQGVGRLDRDGFVENHFWRYYEALYAIYDRLRARFPDVIFENCASGGGRTDLGHVRRFSHTWVTDWQIAPRSFTITNGMSMALPPECVDRLLGGQSGHTTAEFDFQARLLMFVRPTFGFLYPLGSKENPVMGERMRHFVNLYKNFISPWMPTGRIYHHTPAAEGPAPKGWGVLESASRDRKRAICGLFQLSSPQEPEYLLRLRGLDESLTYKVTFDNSNRTCRIDGFTLMKQGLTIRLEGALTSELLIIEAEE